MSATLSDFKKAHLEPASQDHLLAKSGKLPVTLEGSDFEFTTKVELQKLNDEFATPESVRFLLPKGLRKGPQDHMDVQIDTDDLIPAAYELLISQQDGKSHPVDFKILPNPAANRQSADPRQPGRRHAALCPERRTFGD